ncbi:MAG: hypothetical protein WA213_16880, partial [Terriglobales bacterium]
MDSNSWVRIAIFAVILISFLRRIVKVKARSGVPSPTAPGGLSSSTQSKFPSTIRSEFPSTVRSSEFPSTITPTMARPRSGRKNDFRDVPPPPENP